MIWEGGACGSSTCSDVLELLDQGWFFHNILNRAGMVRSLVLGSGSPITKMVDDPVEEFMSANHLVEDDAVPNSRWLRKTPSLPPCIGRKRGYEEEWIRFRSRNSNSHPTNHSLHAPSPSCENLSQSLKGCATHVGTIPKPGPPRSSGISGESMDGKSKNNHCMSRQSSYTRRVKTYRSWKRLSDLECEEVQGFKDLGFIFNKENLNSQVVSVVPGLQRLGEEDGGKGVKISNGSKVSRPYLSEAWLVHRPDSPILNWNMACAKGQSGVDMKKHLKFWARAVASTVLLEC